MEDGTVFLEPHLQCSNRVHLQAKPGSRDCTIHVDKSIIDIVSVNV